MSIPVTLPVTRRKTGMMAIIRERLKGFEVRQLIREEIRRRAKTRVRPYYLSGHQLGMFE